MSDFAKFLSLATAACFIYSAAFIFGELFGIGHTELIWCLTFGDYANYAPAIILIYGIGGSWWLINDAAIRRIGNNRLVPSPSSPEPKNSRFWMVALLFLVSAVVILFGLACFGVIAWRTLVTFATVSTVLGVISVKLYGPIGVAYGQLTADIVDSFFAGIFVAVCLGYFLGAGAARSGPTYNVCTAAGCQTAKFALPLERGMALVQDSGFRLIPWAEIKEMSDVSTAPSSRAQPKPASAHQAESRTRKPTTR